MSTGNKVKIYLAPMEGVIDPFMREQYSAIGGFTSMVTEFVRVTQQILPPKVFYKYCPELLTQGQTLNFTPVYVQLLGSHPVVMGENAALACQLGAPGIDLNFGCPAKTVNRHDGGASLLKNPERIFQVVAAVRKATPAHLPVTAKVRLGYSHKNFCQDIAQAVEAGGAQQLTVHARTKMEAYQPPAHWEFIAKMKSAIKTIPLVANGDIWTFEDFLECKKITGCE
ncbi:MAG: tRNA-dihydrouridine synthase family protein, partial [Bdellovibrionales bacterium]|nr:tRNA-dihydrouridine synthase family protein [Bdellovibrionales bacterium]